MGEAHKRDLTMEVNAKCIDLRLLLDRVDSSKETKYKQTMVSSPNYLSAMDLQIISSILFYFAECNWN